jgi:ATP-binding protein involved in chromosome partitioning
MRIAIPLQQGKFSQHFGGAESFAFYNVDETSRAIGERHLDTPPEHGRGIFPMWLRNQGATVILAGGMGPRAIDILGQQGIEVVLGVRGEDPDAVVQSYLNGTLDASGEVCHEHGYHDCGHDHGSHGGGCHSN